VGVIADDAVAPLAGRRPADRGGDAIAGAGVLEALLPRLIARQAPGLLALVSGQEVDDSEVADALEERPLGVGDARVADPRLLDQPPALKRVARRELLRVGS
jgi:hypothetical protein